MPELLLAENPLYGDYYNPRRRRGKGRRRGGRRRRNPIRRRRGGGGLGRLLSAEGATRALDLQNTAGIAVGFVGFQKLSESFAQTGIWDVVLTIAAAAGVGVLFGRTQFVQSVAHGGVALGLLKGLTLIPGTSQLVSPGSMVIGSAPRRAPMPAGAGVSGRPSLLGG